VTVDAPAHHDTTVVAPVASTNAQLLDGAAQVALAAVAPGLNGHDRARVAGAYALLAGPTSTPRRDSASFLAWVAALGGGPELLGRALAGCATPCDFNAELRATARRHHLDTRALARQFVAGAPAGQRATLTGELR
jgi:hypothetical protein